jgi:hypothetical protein
MHAVAGFALQAHKATVDADCEKSVGSLRVDKSVRIGDLHGAADGCNPAAAHIPYHFP